MRGIEEVRGETLDVKRENRLVVLVYFVYLVERNYQINQINQMNQTNNLPVGVKRMENVE